MKKNVLCCGVLNHELEYLLKDSNANMKAINPGLHVEFKNGLCNNLLVGTIISGYWRFFVGNRVLPTNQRFFLPKLHFLPKFPATPGLIVTVS